MHLADAFIQSDLHCIQVTVLHFLSALAFPGNRTHDLGVASAMLYHLSYRRAIINHKKNIGLVLGLFLKLRLLICLARVGNCEPEYFTRIVRAHKSRSTIGPYSEST